MNRLLTAATLLVSLFVTQTVAESEPCSEPIVAVYVDVDEYSSPDDKVRWRTELTETVLEAMAPTATGVQLTSELDSEFKEPGMDAGRFEYYFLIEIQPGTWPDHEGNLYNMRMTAKLVSRYEKQFLGENVVLLGQEKTLSSMLTDLVARFGSFESLIRNFELKYPAPPRDPVTEVTSDPVELSTCGEPRRAELSVTVKHCNGKPSHTIGEFSPNLVFFEKETERGHVKPKPPFERNSTFRNKSGTARAIYHFDPKKGRYAGEDSVTISYFGRGKKRYESEIFVDLIDPLPSRMDLRMAHSLVTPNEKVDVSITGIRDSAGRVPVWPQDLIVCIDEGRLSGGRPIQRAPVVATTKSNQTDFP